MNKIQFISILIFILFISLAFIFNQMSKIDTIQDNLLHIINEQKAHTQTISKDILYLYKNRGSSTKHIDISSAKFISNMKNKDIFIKPTNSQSIQTQSDKIIKLWKEFYILVSRFKTLHKVATIYSNLILREIVNDIYKQNMKLVVEFNKLINIQEQYFDSKLNRYKNLQYLIFALLIYLLIYLLWLVKDNFAFMQKFLKTSTNIISSSSIKNLSYIKLDTTNKETIQATNNFNKLVDTINSSIEQADYSLEYSYKSLDIVENNIEQLFKFIYNLQQDTDIDKDFTKKEDIVIQSLEELKSSANRLKRLKIDINNLITHDNLK